MIEYLSITSSDMVSTCVASTSILRVERRATKLDWGVSSTHDKSDDGVYYMGIYVWEGESIYITLTATYVCTHSKLLYMHISISPFIFIDLTMSS
jgi:hypothetical protein